MAQATGQDGMTQDERERDIAALEKRRAHTVALLEHERDALRCEQMRFVLRAIDLHLAALRGESDE